jgi:alpha-glucosidase
VLALRRDVQGGPGMLAAFNLSDRPVAFDWPEADGTDEVGGHGLPGTRTGARVALPPFGAWYGLVKAS